MNQDQIVNMMVEIAQQGLPQYSHKFKKLMEEIRTVMRNNQAEIAGFCIPNIVIEPNPVLKIQQETGDAVNNQINAQLMDGLQTARTNEERRQRNIDLQHQADAQRGEKTMTRQQRQQDDEYKERKQKADESFNIFENLFRQQEIVSIIDDKVEHPKVENYVQRSQLFNKVIEEIKNTKLNLQPTMKAVELVPQIVEPKVFLPPTWQIDENIENFVKVLVNE